MSKHKIYITSTKQGQLFLGEARAQDGTLLAKHLSSTPAFLREDMGLTSIRKHKAYDDYFGKGNWELELVKDK